jgi:hypothetical protein
VFLKTPLFYHVNYPGSIPPKACVVFSPCAFLNFRAKNHTHYIYERREYFFFICTQHKFYMRWMTNTKYGYWILHNLVWLFSHIHIKGLSVMITAYRLYILIQKLIDHLVLIEVTGRAEQSSGENTKVVLLLRCYPNQILNPLMRWYYLPLLTQNVSEIVWSYWLEYRSSAHRGGYFGHLAISKETHPRLISMIFSSSASPTCHLSYQTANSL